MPFRLDRAFIHISGPDAIGFLDNLLTQDVTRLEREPVLYSALLSPQGKLVCDMFLWAGREAGGRAGVVIETAPTRKDDLLRRLSLYKLRAQVEIADVASGAHALGDVVAFGSGAADPRFPDFSLGYRDIAFFSIDDLNIPNAGSVYEARRIALGVPDLAIDAQPEEVFALEALLEELNGVDFQKGCFVGQENVSRMKRRATTRKKFCPIVFEGAPPSFGTPVRTGEAELGTVRSGVDGRALALLRLDRAQEAIARGVALTAHGRGVRLDPPPWLILPGDEPD